jgi:hypothetical protein
VFDWNQLKSELFEECKDDHVGLWSIIWQVRHAINDGTFPGPGSDRSDPKEVRRLSLQMARELLESGHVQAGFPTPDGRGFVPWQLSSAEVLARIEREWDSLGREPNIGDVVWFTEGETTSAIH